MTSLQDSERPTDGAEAIERAWRRILEEIMTFAPMVEHDWGMWDYTRDREFIMDEMDAGGLGYLMDDLRTAILKHDPVVRVLVEMARFIDEYETPFHYPSDEERAQYMACPECTRRREDRFFPGDHCDAHYRVMVMKYERRNEDERSFERPRQWREAARAALTAYREAVEESRQGASHGGEQ